MAYMILLAISTYSVTLFWLSGKSGKVHRLAELANRRPQTASTDRTGPGFESRTSKTHGVKPQTARIERPGPGRGRNPDQHENEKEQRDKANGEYQTSARLSFACFDFPVFDSFVFYRPHCFVFFDFCGLLTVYARWTPKHLLSCQTSIH